MTAQSNSSTPLNTTGERIYRWLVIFAGFALLLWMTFRFPMDIQLGFMAFIALFILMQYGLPLRLLGNEINLIQIISLGGGLLYGAPTAGWSVVVGVFLGRILRKRWPSRLNRMDRAAAYSWQNAAFNAGRQNLALL
ncbi:MAG TPA: hypothetical protein VF823_08400, partial [Anaerolineales bacterium]